MGSITALYYPGTSVIHRADARVKFVMLVAVSIAVFFVETWVGLGILAAAVIACIVVAGLPAGRLCVLSVPLVIILVFIWACNAFALDVSSVAPSGLGGVSAGFAAGWQPIALVGSFGFVPEGCMRGLFYAVRILLILFASLVVTFTTPAERLTGAFLSLLRPLRRVRVPVDDVALTLSVALRFIPLVAAELDGIQRAQRSRGADFVAGGLVKRVLSWQTVFVPLIVSLFRRAGALGGAMEARCYGAHERTSLDARALSAGSVIALAAGLACCVAVCVAL